MRRPQDTLSQASQVGNLRQRLLLSKVRGLNEGPPVASQRQGWCHPHWLKDRCDLLYILTLLLAQRMGRQVRCGLKH